MLTGRCCHCSQKPTTIKGIDKNTGQTLWSYGPGVLWTQHYGSSHVSGVVVPLQLTMNRYVRQAVANSAGNGWTPRGSRGVFPAPPGGLPANCQECVTLVKLDGITGQVLSTILVEGVFLESPNPPPFYTVLLRRIVGLSGGDVVSLETRTVQVEWVNYSTDTQNKQYVLHAHTQQAGNVYFRTSPSDEYITVPYNATAAQVQAAFQATADCVAASASGGPWPHRKISLDLVWSQPTGDILYFRTDHSYSVSSGGGGGTCTWDWVLSPTGDYWGLNTNNCTGGAVPTPPAAPGVPGDNDIPGTCVGGSSGPSTLRQVYGVATRYSTTTGLIESSVGYRFGLRSGPVPPNLVTATTTPPTSSIPATAGIDGILAGENDTVVVETTNGQYLESWDPGGNWTSIWQRYVNPVWCSFSNRVYQNKFVVTFQRKDYSTGNKAYVVVTASTGATVEYDSARTNVGRRTGVGFIDGGTSSVYEVGYDSWLSGSTYYSLDGSRVYDGVTDLHLPRYLHQADSTAYYGQYGNWVGIPVIDPPSRFGSPIANTNAQAYVYRFYCSTDGKTALSSQFRFKWAYGDARATEWLPYSATVAQMKAAILAVFPDNTAGVVSNVTMYLGGALGGNYVPIIGNSDYGVFDVGLWIQFAAYRNAAGKAEGYMDPNLLQYNRLILEWQNLTPYIPNTIFSASRTNGTVNWSKRWGLRNGEIQTGTLKLFVLMGDVLVVAGPYIDTE